MGSCRAAVVATAHSKFPEGGSGWLASIVGVSRSASFFFGEFTRVEIGHIVIGSAG